MYTRDLDEVLDHISAQKCHLKRFLKRNFKEGVHYRVSFEKIGKNGRPRERVMLREEVYEMVLNNYDKRNRYFAGKNSHLMCIENATLGFLQESLKGIVEVRRQCAVGRYKVDMYIPACKLGIECDEFGHREYDAEAERARHEFIEQHLGCELMRVNPNDVDFELPKLVNEVLRRVMRVNPVRARSSHDARG